jgi:hypothetical protein
MALNNSPIHKLIVVDSAPIQTKFKIFEKYILAMKHIESQNISSHAQADTLLKPTVPELSIRQFLLTNLKSENGKYKFRINLQALHEAMSHLLTFPVSNEKKFYRPTLFIAGLKGDHLMRESYPAVKSFFPKAKIDEVDAGHWYG